MTNVSSVQAPVEALPDEVDSQKRHWLQAFHPPVERVTAPQVQEAANPESIVADFIRQHSASGHLVARSVFLQPPYSVPETDLSALLETLCQDANNADITRDGKLRRHVRAGGGKRHLSCDCRGGTLRRSYVSSPL